MNGFDRIVCSLMFQGDRNHQRNVVKRAIAFGIIQRQRPLLRTSGRRHFPIAGRPSDAIVRNQIIRVCVTEISEMTDS